MDEAEKEFKTAISLDPHYAEAQNNLGSLYGQQGKNADAERLLRQAIENNPGYAEAFVNLGIALASESRLKDAETALQDALRIEPNDEHAIMVRDEIRTQMARQDKNRQ